MLTTFIAAGVRRVNISLDTLDEQKFADVTRWGRLPQVMKGIDAAQKAGLRVKINAVALKGFNEEELPKITAWCAERGLDLTWIEVMPMGEDFDAMERIGQYWSLEEVRAEYENHYTVTDLAERTGGPAAMCSWRRPARRSASSRRCHITSVKAATGCGSLAPAKSTLASARKAKPTCAHRCAPMKKAQVLSKRHPRGHWRQAPRP